MVSLYLSNLEVVNEHIEYRNSYKYKLKEIGYKDEQIEKIEKLKDETIDYILTLKKDKNGMSKMTTGYIQIVDGKLYDVEFETNENGKYTIKYSNIEENKVKKLKKG